MKVLSAQLMSLSLFCGISVQAETGGVITVQSPDNRVALLELYTSEGCSSCPPAEQWLSNLKKSGISSQQLIPLAFHVTYWDYIGWEDRFASDVYDQRQREIARNNSKSTIYTPQFVLNGSDYRNYNQFSSDVNKLVSQKSVVDLKLSARIVDDVNINVKLNADLTGEGITGVMHFITIYEDNLNSNVEEGENEGELLHHDYVVRQLYGPFKQERSSLRASFSRSMTIDDSWKKDDLYVVAFAQSLHTGEVLQAVKLKLREVY